MNNRSQASLKALRRLVPALAVALAASAAHAGLIISESFETDGNGTRYTLSQDEFRIGNTSYFMRSNDSQASGQNLPNTTSQDRRYGIEDNGGVYGNVHGAFAFVAEDMDAGGVSDVATVTFNPFSTLGLNGPVLFIGYFGAGDNTDGSPSYETDDYIRVTYDLGDGEVTALQFTAVSGGNNNLIAQDTDFNGFGDGVLLTAFLQPFSFNIPTGAPSVTIRIHVRSNAARDELAFDNILVYIPEPASASVLLAGAMLVMRRRR